MVADRPGRAKWQLRDSLTDGIAGIRARGLMGISDGARRAAMLKLGRWTRVVGIPSMDLWHGSMGATKACEGGTALEGDAAITEIAAG